MFRLEHVYPTNWQGSLRYHKKEAVFVLGTLQQRIGIRLIYMSTDLVRYCVQSQIQVVTSNGSGEKIGETEKMLKSAAGDKTH